MLIVTTFFTTLHFGYRSISGQFTAFCMICQKEFLKELWTKAGVGFISGHGIATATSIYHAIFKAPSGKEVEDFYYNFKDSAKKNAISMATWAALNAVVEPNVKKHINHPKLQSMISGAISSAIMSCRNGSADILKNAISGAAQSLAITMLGSGVEAALEPLDIKLTKNISEKFYAERGEAVMKSPTEAITEVFIH